MITNPEVVATDFEVTVVVVEVALVEVIVAIAETVQTVGTEMIDVEVTTKLVTKRKWTS